MAQNIVKMSEEVSQICKFKKTAVRCYPKLFWPKIDIKIIEIRKMKKKI